MAKRPPSRSAAPAHPTHVPLPNELKAGYEAFREARFPQERRLFLKRAKSQHPNTLVIGCVDSRAAPEIIFDAAPGDLFVVRNIAALVPPHSPSKDPKGTPAGLEYAVKALKVAHVVVLGHSGCGGIRGWAEGKQPKVNACGELIDRKNEHQFEYVGAWLGMIDETGNRLGKPPTDPKALNTYCDVLCKETIKETLRVIRGYPWVKDAECLGKLSLHGAYFCIEDAELYALDQCSNDFVPVRAEHIAVA